MNPPAIITGWSLSAPVRGAGIGERIAGLLLGVGFTLGLFIGIAHYELGQPAQPPAALDDLHATMALVEPPPLPVKPTETVPDMTPMAGFELSPAASPVTIAVSPPDLAAILPEDLSKAPPANAQIGLLLTDFKPKMELAYDSQHIYQKSEVDRPPKILERPNPQVSSRVRNDAAALRVSLIAVINADGAVGNIQLVKSSGNVEFDKLIIESLKEWVFSPAMKGGKNVRCLIEQGITVQWSNGSVFHL